jgi:hypothetical protein
VKAAVVAAALEQNKRAKHWQSLHGAARVTKALDYKNPVDLFH